jgi:curved DNA-binding protein CbpA
MQQVAAAYEILREPKLRAAYDKRAFRNEVADSTVRVRVHRARLSKKEKRCVISIDTKRKKLLSMKGVDQPAKAKVVLKRSRVVAVRKVSSASTVLTPTDSWLVVKRGKAEKKKDKRLSSYFAVPASLASFL